MQHKIDVQTAENGAVDVLINGDHWNRFPFKSDAWEAIARHLGRVYGVAVRDFTATAKEAATHE